MLTVRASRDSILPALRFACAKNGMVYTRMVRDEPELLVFELMTVRDEPAQVTGVRAGESDLWSFEAEVGRFGNVGLEAALLIMFGERLNAVRAAGQ